MPEFKDDTKVIFEETKGQVREFCEQFYTKTPDGYLHRNKETVSPTILINDMVAKNKLSDKELLKLLE